MKLERPTPKVKVRPAALGAAAAGCVVCRAAQHGCHRAIGAERVQRDKDYDGAAGATARGPTKQIDTPVLEGIHAQLPGY